MSIKNIILQLKKGISIFYIAFILVGIIMSSYAASLQGAYINAPSKTIDPNLEGFIIMQNEPKNKTKVEIEYFMMAIILEPPTLAISCQFKIEKTETYNISFHFPFRIKEINNSFGFPIPAEFQVINNKMSGSIVLTEIYAQEDLGKLNETISCEFLIEETFTSGKRGNYFVNVRFTFLPYMGTILNETEWARITWSREFLESLVPINNFFLFFLYPKGITVTQAFPEFSVGPVRWPSPNYLPDMESITWYFKKLEARELSILVYYNDNEEYEMYQQMLFNSGLWYGIGFSVILTGIFEFAKTSFIQPRIYRKPN